MTSTRRALALLLPLVCCIAFGAFIRREAIGSGFFADDYAQLGMVDGTYPLRRAPYDLYTFSDGSSVEGEHLIRTGFYPWWADPTVRISMFRPLASLMTHADFYLWGSNALGYHLHSFAWWAILTVVVSTLYHRWLSRSAALAALALYVCDEAHGIALGWICNRSALISSTFSLLALALYVSYRRRLRSHLLGGATACFVVALGFGEYALCSLGYFISYELLRSTDPCSCRLRALAPMGGAALIYLVIRSAAGMTMARSGLYADLGQPVAFGWAVLTRAPVLIADMVFALSADYWTWGSPLVHLGVSKGWLEERWLHDLGRWRAVHTGLGVVACAAAALWFARAWRRSTADRHAWLLLGALLSIVPVCGSFPSSRLTVVAAFGFMPALVAAAHGLWKGAPRRTTRVVLGVGLLLYHVILPVGFERDESLRIHALTEMASRAILDIDVLDAELREKDLVLLNAPEVATSMYFPLTRQRYGRSAPRSCRYLSLVPDSYLLTRVASNAFTMRMDGSAAMLQTPHEQLLRGAQALLRVGDEIDGGDFRVRILELLEGHPKAVRVDFARDLDDPNFLFMRTTAQGYRRVWLPPVGEAVVIDAPEFPSIRGRSVRSTTSHVSIGETEIGERGRVGPQI